MGDIGRFPKNPTNFIPQVARDPHLGGPPQDDFPFGREFAPINAKPPHYVFDNLINAADWLTRALDVQGYRIDDVKGLSTDFLRPFLDSKSMAGKFSVGEFFDGNRILVNGWIFNPTGMQGRCSAFDFPTKFVLTAMCNNPGRFNMSDLDHIGLAGISPLNAVTFVENHDTDLNNGEKIFSNKILGYAYILTSEGYPCVYYRDYSTGPNGFGLRPHIDNLVWIHEKLAAGPTQQRFLDFNLFAYERLGGPHLLVALNNDPENQRTISVATGFGAQVALHDYTGHSGDVFTDGSGNVTITVPRNNGGLGYVCYSRAGQDGGFEITTRPVTQDFEGAADLDILPATVGKIVQPCRVWCAANSQISAVMRPDTTGWDAATTITVKLLAPDGTILGQRAITNQNAGTPLTAEATTEGFHTFTLTAANTPATNPTLSYTLSVTYTAPAVFTPAVGAEAAVAAVVENPAEVGQWSDLIKLANVPIHTHVLPTGKVLFWGRRKEVASQVYSTLNDHATEAFIWDPANAGAPGRQTSNSPSADAAGKETINLFCSGHTFLADGTLLVTGGHLFDSQGLANSTLYNPFTDRWSPGPVMNNGRWYPTAMTLPNGSAFVLSGSFPTGSLHPPPNGNNVNNIPQFLENGAWQNATQFNNLPLFPRLHVAPDGSIFMSGSNFDTFFLKGLSPGNQGTWIFVGNRSAGNSDYAPSVMFDVGKVMFIGGGAPTNIVEVIDLNSPNPAWAKIAPMKLCPAPAQCDHPAGRHGPGNRRFAGRTI